MRFTCEPWGLSMPAHDRLTVRPATRADAAQIVLALEVLATHMRQVRDALPVSDDTTFAPPRIDCVVPIQGLRIGGRALV